MYIALKMSYTYDAFSHRLAIFITWCIFHNLDYGFTVGVGLICLPPFIGLNFTLKRYENIHQSRYLLFFV